MRSLSRQDACAAFYWTARRTPSPSSPGFKGMYSSSLVSSSSGFCYSSSVNGGAPADVTARSRKSTLAPLKSILECTFRPSQFRYLHSNFLSPKPVSKVDGLWTLSLQALLQVSNLAIGLVRGVQVIQARRRVWRSQVGMLSCDASSSTFANHRAAGDMVLGLRKRCWHLF